MTDLKNLPRRRIKLVPLTAAIAAVLVCAACGSAAIARVVHAGSTSGSQQTTRTTTSSPVLAAVKFTECMRAHGVPMLDPGPDGDILYNAPDTPEAVIRQAQQACNHLLPKVTINPQQHAAMVAKMVSFAHCMLAHNTPVTLITSPGVGYAYPSGVSPRSQAYASANAICTKEYLKTSG